MTSVTASVVNLAASILAGIATIILAVFAGMQWRVMKENNEAAEQQNKLARDRWEREDQLRKKENEPKAVIEIGSDESSPEIIFYCHNLGKVSFVIDKLIFAILDHNGSKREVHSSDFALSSILSPGQSTSTRFDCTSILKGTYQEASVVFTLKGILDTTCTEPVWFYFSKNGESKYIWRLGRLKDQLPGSIPQQTRAISTE